MCRVCVGAGASDDAAGCAVLLETLRALAAAAAPRHDAVFLFNAAEENVLQASHAFITQHKYVSLNSLRPPLPFHTHSPLFISDNAILYTPHVLC